MTYRVEKKDEKNGTFDSMIEFRELFGMSAPVSAKLTLKLISIYDSINL